MARDRVNAQNNANTKQVGEDRLEQALLRLTNEVAQLAHGQNELRNFVAQLAQGQQRLQEVVARLTVGQEQLQSVVTQLAEEQRQLSQGQQQLAQGQQQLQEVVARLTVGQEQLQAAVTNLTEEQRQLAQRQKQLQEVVARLVIGQEQLQAAVTNLTEEQRQLSKRHQKLEEVVTHLIESQQQMQQLMAELSDSNRKVAGILKEVNKKVGRIDEQLGLSVEAVAQVVLPTYLEKKHDIKLKGEPGYELRPLFIFVNGKREQIDLYGEGTKDGEEICVVCECKARIYERDVRSFIRKLSRWRLHLKKRVVAILFGFFVHPSSEWIAKVHRIILFGALQR